MGDYQWRTFTQMDSEAESFGRGLRELGLRPTIIAAVPLILDRIYKAIVEKIEAGSPLSKAIFNMALDYKLDWYERGYSTPLINS